ncbi:TetR/AcrR family transcriptional regulator [Herbiconiux solani]|uniref:TetR/AcrR family transcriptional regulator n=1 Tax=Herbiconiux solani TaxID=661329 RepID=UPI0009FD8251|nr:TetR/AcrR family transcriptional regulator [Herbiconiux solani]
MANDTRQQMIDGTVHLLARGGLQQTSFATVLERTGAPRGSIYHHFPEGKDQLVSEAVAASGARSIAMIEAWRGEPADVIAERFFTAWRYLLTVTEFRAGCAVLAVTTATESADVLGDTAKVFRDWRAVLAELLAEGGLPGAHADGIAAMLIAAAEGAVVMSRAERRIDPFDLVAGEVLAYVRTLVPPPSAPAPSNATGAESPTGPA